MSSPVRHDGPLSVDRSQAEELLNRTIWVVDQIKEWPEIIVGFEGANKYRINDENGKQIGFVAEESAGFIALILRLFLRSHRPLRAAILDGQGAKVLEIYRPFFFIWSSLFLSDAFSRPIGEVHRRFGWGFQKKYDLVEKSAGVFARIYAGLFRIWKFDFLTASGDGAGFVTKKWKGLLKEAFTDADRFLITLEGRGATFSLEQKALLLAASISIDFDYFEENQGFGSLLGTLTDWG